MVHYHIIPCGLEPLVTLRQLSISHHHFHQVTMLSLKDAFFFAHLRPFFFQPLTRYYDLDYRVCVFLPSPFWEAIYCIYLEKRNVHILINATLGLCP